MKVVQFQQPTDALSTYLTHKLPCLHQLTDLFQCIAGHMIRKAGIERADKITYVYSLDKPFQLTYFIIVSSGREDNLTASWIVIPGIMFINN